MTVAGRIKPALAFGAFAALIAAALGFAGLSLPDEPFTNPMPAFMAACTFPPAFLSWHWMDASRSWLRAALAGALTPLAAAMLAALVLSPGNFHLLLLATLIAGLPLSPVGAVLALIFMLFEKKVIRTWQRV